MKVIKIFAFIILLAGLAAAQDYKIDWYVIASGGGHSQSGDYQVNGTIGQPIVGKSLSSEYIIEAGFWVGAKEPQLGYEYIPGDVNMYNGDWPPMAIGGDVTYLVNYFRSVPTSLPCMLDGFWASADVNGDCSVIGSDVTKLVNYFRGIGYLEYCPDYPPLPPSAPPGWPNCEAQTFSREAQIIPNGFDQ